MKIKYLSFRQAAAICSAFTYLEGQVFDEKTPSLGYVRDVLVAPYSRIMQWDFLRKYVRGAAPAQLVREMPCQGKFDVIVLADKIMNKQKQFLAKDLRTYLAEHNIAFPADLYTGIRSPGYHDNQT